MRPDALDMEGITLDGEVETPVLVDASLPQVSHFVKLLGVKTGMSKVADQEFELGERLVPCFLLQFAAKL